MSYVGGVGVLMTGSGLEELMKAVFGSVTKMLTGKNLPQKTRALRIVVEQVVHQILSFDEIMQELRARASKSGTAKQWVENFILRVLLMLIFIRVSERRVGPTFVAVNEMIPYFFAAGHIHYARYGESTSDQCKSCMGKP